MDWGTCFLLGNFGEQSEINQTKEMLDRLRRSAASNAGKDFEQDQQLQLLGLENQRLKFFVGALSRLLIDKSVITSQEVQRILEEINPPPPREDTEPSGDDLTAIANAVKTT